VSLNVAINSYDNALLTLLLSNQFVEIKGAVFKKFEKENLFQMSCAGGFKRSSDEYKHDVADIDEFSDTDIVERFQLSLMLCIIAMRNLIELNGSTFSLLPTSFILSEMFVDWLKHAFITKFNHSEY
jgi:hypothetical protein